MLFIQYLTVLCVGYKYYPNKDLCFTPSNIMYSRKPDANYCILAKELSLLKELNICQNVSKHVEVKDDELELNCRNNGFIDVNKTAARAYDPKYGTFLMEIQRTDGTKKAFIYLMALVTFEDLDLEPDTSYNVSIWHIKPNQRYSVIVNNWQHNTLKDRNEPVYVDDYSFETDDRRSSHVRWNSAVLVRRICGYKIFFIPEKYTPQYYKCIYSYDDGVYESCKVKIDDLEFDHVYGIAFKASNSSFNTSHDTVWKNLRTPSCLGANYDSSICPPRKPTGLAVSLLTMVPGEHRYNLSWDQPENEPDFYNIEYSLSLPNRTNYKTSVGIELKNSSSVLIPILISDECYTVNFVVMAFKNHQNSSATISFELNKNYILALYIGVPITVLVIIVIIIVALAKIYCYNSNRKPKISYENIILTLPKIEKDKNMEIDMADLQLFGILGNGEFGLVRRGILTTAENAVLEVAVKSLKPNSNEECILEFQKEILLMKTISRHPNIVNIIGHYTKDFNNLMLITEYCSRGSLVDLFMDDQKCRTAEEQNTNDPKMGPLKNLLRYVDLLRIAMQVASGMVHLSERKIVHRDLAARNILVCDDRTVKISDFGLSRDVYQDNIYKKTGDAKLPLKWMAIESLTYQVYTTQSDVWSFGVLLYEIVTLGGVPYPTTPKRKLVEFLEKGRRMEKPLRCEPKLFDLMSSCWMANPNDRPSFKKVHEDLTDLFNNAVSEDQEDNLAVWIDNTRNKVDHHSHHNMNI